jgi:hypothetical protein
MHNIPGFVYAASQTISTATTTDGPIRQADYYNSCLIVLDITTLDGTQTLQLEVYGPDPVADGVAGAACTMKLDAGVAYSSTGKSIIAVGLEQNPLSAYITDANAMEIVLPLYYKLAYVTTTADDATFSVGVIPICNRS